MAILNIHRADGSIFEKVPIDNYDGEHLAKVFHLAQCRDQNFYGSVTNYGVLVAMVYCGENKNVVRVVFCTNHTNQEFIVEAA